MSYDLFSSVILTYKGKMLLLAPDIPSLHPQQSLWSLIGGKKVGRESTEQTIYRSIRYTTKLDLKNINLLTSNLRNSDECIYHGELTDMDVNSMQRREGQRLEFYTISELEKLPLSETAKNLLTEYMKLTQQK